MASEAQIDANRRNAQLSTGPKTPEGKAAVSTNALKHGLRSDLYKKPSLDPEVFDHLLAELIAEHQPQTITEEVYVERMALCLDKLTFIEGLQNECLFNQPRKLIPSDNKGLIVYWNQEERLERAFDRALSALRKLQKERRAAQREATPEPPAGRRRNRPSPRLSPPSNQSHAFPWPAESGFKLCPFESTAKPANASGNKKFRDSSPRSMGGHRCSSNGTE